MRWLGERKLRRNTLLADQFNVDLKSICLHNFPDKRKALTAYMQIRSEQGSLRVWADDIREYLDCVSGGLNET